MLKVANALKHVGAWLFVIGTIAGIGMYLITGEDYGRPFLRPLGALLAVLTLMAPGVLVIGLGQWLEQRIATHRRRDAAWRARRDARSKTRSFPSSFDEQTSFTRE